MAAKKKGAVVVATAAVATQNRGVQVFINIGDVYPADSPLVKRLGRVKADGTGMFATPEEYAALQGRVVEQATSGPGEVRNVEIPKE